MVDYNCYDGTYESNGSAGDDYFPELSLSKNLNQPIYSILCDCTIDDIKNAYSSLYPSTDSIYLVDGGCDVLMIGSEDGLGTPVEI